MRAGIKKNAFTMFSAHQMGTSKMGVDPKTSVVDPEGQCWEVSKGSSLFLGSGVVAAALPMLGVLRKLCCLSSGGEFSGAPPRPAEMWVLAVPAIAEAHLGTLSLWEAEAQG